VTLADAWLTAWTTEGGFAECCTADVSYEDPLTAVPLTGAAEIDGHAALLRGALPDVAIELTAPMLEGGGHGCIPWKLTGTQDGDLGPLPATEKRLELHGLHYVELRDGRIARARGFFDLYDGAVQLGLLPQRGGLGEAALLMLRGFGVTRR
jgi:SnoaL-like polyketide cyclase